MVDINKLLEEAEHGEIGNFVERKITDEAMPFWSEWQELGIQFPAVAGDASSFEELLIEADQVPTWDADPPSRPDLLSLGTLKQKEVDFKKWITRSGLQEVGYKKWVTRNGFWKNRGRVARMHFGCDFGSQMGAKGDPKCI